MVQGRERIEFHEDGFLTKAAVKPAFRRIIFIPGFTFMGK
jgi:hypothetical protein